MIYEGATPLRSATKEEAATMPVFSTWGLKVISLLAERAFVEGLPLVRGSLANCSLVRPECCRALVCRGVSFRTVRILDGLRVLGLQRFIETEESQHDHDGPDLQQPSAEVENVNERHAAEYTDLAEDPDHHRKSGHSVGQPCPRPPLKLPDQGDDLGSADDHAEQQSAEHILAVEGRALQDVHEDALAVVEQHEATRQATQRLEDRNPQQDASPEAPSRSRRHSICHVASHVMSALGF